MIWTGGLAGFWILALLSLNTAELGETKMKEPDVPFPPAQPNAQNLAAICQHGSQRPRYPPSFFPRSGFSHWRRRGEAINRLESWYGLCCSGEAAQQSGGTLCCAQQAWKEALTQFCTEEISTKTLVYECCEYTDDAQWTCFDSELPNPEYNPIPGATPPPDTLLPGFTFNPADC